MSKSNAMVYHTITDPVIQLYMHTKDIDVKSFAGYSRDVDKWF